MPRYTEEVVIIDINERPAFGEKVEDALRQGYVPLGSPRAEAGTYIMFMIKQKLAMSIEAGYDVREYMTDLYRARALMNDKKEPSDGEVNEDTVEVPFG